MSTLSEKVGNAQSFGKKSLAIASGVVEIGLPLELAAAVNPLAGAAVGALEIILENAGSDRRDKQKTFLKSVGRMAEVAAPFYLLFVPGAGPALSMSFVGLSLFRHGVDRWKRFT